MRGAQARFPKGHSQVLCIVKNETIRHNKLLLRNSEQKSRRSAEKVSVRNESSLLNCFTRLHFDHLFPGVSRMDLAASRGQPQLGSQFAPQDNRSRKEIGSQAFCSILNEANEFGGKMPDSQCPKGANSGRRGELRAQARHRIPPRPLSR
jgi:hypothetical protein